MILYNMKYKLLKIKRELYKLRVIIFGIKVNYDMYHNAQGYDLPNDFKYVVNFIKENYPEYIGLIDFSSDTFDGFHPSSISCMAFMRIHLECLKCDKIKKQLIREFAYETKKRYMYHTYE